MTDHSQLKMSYVTKLLANKPDSKVAQFILEEERLAPGVGIIGEVKELSSQFNIRDVTERFVDPEIIKKEVMFKALRDIWDETR